MGHRRRHRRTALDAVTKVMQAGDRVVFIADPLAYGPGTIERVQPNGRIVVVFDDGREELFTPHELELLDVWAQAGPAG
jgi:hypothetical protein